MFFRFVIIIHDLFKSSFEYLCYRSMTIIAILIQILATKDGPRTERVKSYTCIAYVVVKCAVKKRTSILYTLDVDI